MTFKNNREKFGPMFEAVAKEHGFDITHSLCQCGEIGCGYDDYSTAFAFAGFIFAFEAIANKNGMILSPEPIPGITSEKVRIVKVTQ